MLWLMPQELSVKRPWRVIKWTLWKIVRRSRHLLDEVRVGGGENIPSHAFFSSVWSSSSLTHAASLPCSTLFLSSVWPYLLLSFDSQSHNKPKIEKFAIHSNWYVQVSRFVYVFELCVHLVRMLGVCLRFYYPVQFHIWYHSRCASNHGWQR